MNSARLGIIEGTIAQLDVGSHTGSLKLTSVNGRTRVLTLDRPTASVWRNGEAIKPDELTPGQKVGVQYVRKDDKDVVRSIVILDL